VRRIRRQLVRKDQLAEVLDGRRGQTNVCHLQLVETDRLAARGLVAAELHPLPRSWDPIEHGRKIRRLALYLRQRFGEQSDRQVVLLRMRALGQGGETRSRLLIEIDADLMRPSRSRVLRHTATNEGRCPPKRSRLSPYCPPYRSIRASRSPQSAEILSP
jgi:hypothetical protein